MHGDGMLTIWFLCGGKPWYQYITSADPWAPPLVGRRNALLLWLSSMHNIIKLKRKISLSKNLWFWVFENFQRIKGDL
jgi:hypothetical protein